MDVFAAGILKGFPPVFDEKHERDKQSGEDGNTLDYFGGLEMLLSSHSAVVP